MSVSCHSHAGSASDSASLSAAADPRYRRILWTALALNLAMFIVELAAGLTSGSVSLLADAIDFFGDAANYGLSLAVLSMALVVRARAALFKAACMLGFGLFVLGKVAWVAHSGIAPQALTMGAVGFLALCANLGVAALLYAYRNGDANMQSVWLCSRNDALSNIAVMLAALGVFGTTSAWPDLLVATIMGLLAISSARTVFAAAQKELPP